ncbi:MAG: SAM-dependent chlorinase/fluorinase [Planctomycetota bacterium]
MAKFSFSSPTPPVVLLTDFGFQDSYVGVMKGAVLSTYGFAPIVDLSHNILPQDVTQAAFMLYCSYRYFPENSVFAAVIDPGVGTDRKILCMEAANRLFLAPDNGLLSLVEEEEGAETIREVNNEELFLQEPSGTFHGRDIFAPVAAHLCSGTSPSEVGPEVESFRKLNLPKPVHTADDTLRGEIIYIDHFGNLITNISRGMVETSFECPVETIRISVKQHTIEGISETYSSVKEGELVALVGSTGYLEVAVKNGSALELLQAERGDRVVLARPVEGGEE